MKCHEAAKIFPLLEGDDFDALVTDIQTRGLLYPGVTFGGLLLDGRNRERACAAASHPFRTVVLKTCDSPTAYVLSANLKRRHLTAIQRTAVAVEALPFFEAEAKERQRAGARAGGGTAGRGRPKAWGQTAPKANGAGAATARAAKATGAGTKNTKALVAIKRAAPEVYEAVKSGLIAKVSEARAVTGLPEEQRGNVLGRVREGTPVKEAFRAVKNEADAKAVETSKRRTDRYHVVVSDITNAKRHVEAGSVDVIVADPPYGREDLVLYSELAAFASHALRPGGSLLAMAGQSYLPELLQRLCGSHDLVYHWTLAYLTPGGQSASVWARAVNCFWKPVVWLVKGDDKPDGRRGDVIKSDTNANEKDAHEWQQSESGIARLVEGWSNPGDLVCDPFCGSGTTGAVALQLGRRFIGLDVDDGAIAQTLARVRTR